MDHYGGDLAFRTELDFFLSVHDEVGFHWMANDEFLRTGHSGLFSPDFCVKIRPSCLRRPYG
jgi:hypothetical protein